MSQVLDVAVQIALNILVPWWIVRRDLRRLRGVELDRSWNDASFWSAIVVFNQLAIPVHFIKTRRSLRGVLIGIGWMAVAIGVNVAVAWLFEALFG